MLNLRAHQLQTFMRRGGGSQKGSSFEREICKTLSKWWSIGLGFEPRDDIFWRSSQSGGRATQRAKSGKRTANSYGDIAAVDPIGQPLLKVFTLELKRGRSHGHPEDLIDCAATRCVRPFEACLNQAIQAHQQAKSLFWMLICQRDRKVPMVYMQAEARTHLNIILKAKRGALYRLEINTEDGWPEPISFYALSLEEWLRLVPPHAINFLAIQGK